jgi:iron complex outermembrane receptor protein
MKQVFGRLMDGCRVALLGSLLGLATTAAAQQPAAPQGGQDLLELPLERFAAEPVRISVAIAAAPAAAAATPVPAAAPLALQQVVTTVERQESTVARSPAAVFVVTSEMIRRSGATTIPDALRMVPGLDVARIDSSSWAISARGFNDRFATKLLVQIDGRTVYNPLFSGVFWDAQDLLLEDVERIEVIRGPGATVYGANAVNGIINIITKNAQDTQGGLITSGGGTYDKGTGGLRYGGKLGDNAYYRVWGKWFEHGAGFSPVGEADDSWRQGRGGFRIDWQPSARDAVMLQGELFGESAGTFENHPTPFPQSPPPFQVPSFIVGAVGDRIVSGGDVLGLWEHKIDKNSGWHLQVYYDNFALRFSDITSAINTFDLDFQQQFPLTARQQLIYGVGYRFQNIITRPSTDNGFQFEAFPPDKDLHLPSAFVQDQFTLVRDRLYFIAGSKFEHNDYTGFEYEPTGRLLWTPNDRHSAWAAISRAVRIPAFSEEQVRDTQLPVAVAPIGPGVPTFPRVFPNPNFQSEDVIAYELGYRAQPTVSFFWDVALFVNDYSKVAIDVPIGAPVLNPGPPPFIILPLTTQNLMAGNTYGAELAATWKLAPWWQLFGAYTFLDMELHADPTLPPAIRAVGEARTNGQSPRNQVYLRSSWDLPARMEVDAIGRYVDILPGFDPVVPPYFELDVRWAWKPAKNLEISVVGQNLLQDHHVEFGTSPFLGFPRIEIPRGVYGMVSYRW